jgi:hypothetical protein
MSTATNTQQRPSAINTILLAGFVAGTLDIAAACTQFYINTGKDPMIVLRYVASGVFGKKAFTGGLPMAAWGLFFHYLIAFGLAIFFFWLFPKIKWVRQNVTLAGLLYGIFAWLITTQVIVSLSRIGHQPIVFSKVIVAVLILMFCIGLPIAYITANHYRKAADR